MSHEHAKQLTDALGLYGQLKPDSKWMKYPGQAERAWLASRSAHMAGTPEIQKTVLAGRGLGLPMVPAKFNKQIAEALEESK